VDGLSVADAHGQPVSISQYAVGAGYVTLSGLSFGQVPSTSVNLYGLDAFTITDSELGDPSGYGLYAYTTQATGNVTTIQNVHVDGPSSQGMYLRGGIVDVAESSVLNGSSSGFYFDTATVSATGNVASQNAQYGFQCSAVTIDICYNNDLSGNALGEQSGCAAECGLSD
jgi:hypothetical protein